MLKQAGSVEQIAPPYSVDNAAKLLGVSGRHLCKLADEGKVRMIRLGRRRLVPFAELKRIAEGCVE